MPIFWVISTAFVLQGVIIAARGPTKNEPNDDISELKEVNLFSAELLNNQYSFLMSSCENWSCFWTAKTVEEELPKK